MRGVISFLIIALAIVTFSWINSDKKELAAIFTAKASNSNKAVTKSKRLKIFSPDIKKYAKQNNYNSEFCFLINMKLPSGSKRFFIYDLEKDSVIDAGLVTHGSGSDNGDKNLFFSNAVSSNCTSIGKYKVGNAYFGRFGLAYKLYGLDKTNSNAFNRFVVLHSHSCVPENEITPLEICRSQGCPTVAPAFLSRLKTYLDKSQKPVLLQIFY